MATGADPKKTDDNLDDLLKCTICLETFKEPKCLPCLHTFCKLCIHTYIDSLKEKKGEIPCPICRKPFSSTNCLDDTDSVVDKLPSNNFVISLLEKQTISERQCNHCCFKGQPNEAMFWCGICEESYCQECVKFHKSNKSLAKHKIVCIKDMQSKAVDLNETSVIFCDEHRERVVEVYCVDHKTACCTLCATLSHRICEKVISIEEAATGIKQSGEVVDLLSKLDEFKGLLTDVINCRNENEDTFNTESTTIETAVTKIVKEMKDHLDKIQSKILSELEATKKQTSMKVTDDINDFTSYKSAVISWKRMLAGVVNHGSEQQCLVIQNEIASKVEKLKDEINDSLRKIRNTFVRFEVSSNAKEFKEKIQSIGKLNVEESKLKYERGKLGLFRTDFRSGEIKVIRTINVTPSGETSGIFMDDMLFFTAKNTKKVVKYNQTGELLKELTVPNAPTDLCYVSNSRIVVASDEKNELYTIDCSNMTLLTTMKLRDVPVYGLHVYNNNQFLIGSQKQITWVDQSTGTATKSIMTEGSSYYVSTLQKNDYIYGDGSDSATYVVNGTKTFTYRNDGLSTPCGNGIDDDGNFYITGYTSKNIHQLTNTGTLIRIIPAFALGLVKPLVIRFEKGTNKFLVTCDSSGKASLCCIE